ncbi:MULTISPECIES: outer membrane protein OmpW [Erwinia]|uniref:Outer membrane protein OmpW n=1 Tax=Erwinia rhapontici TaxID=55212 RepID=A0ABN6DN38_ERWRD|nr:MULTISPECIES: outer membrane protein OmpW [Erwinia]NNS05482.1 outer membrane protein OmpW [Erwinia sp. JH02]TDT02362.1 outer membrane protein [Erwinia rhapontici]UDQ78362.1 outer membrane protein OmpW [Erwinia rhapontici]BCQ35283.1 outer membrane protein OmpW [Erwinia rhapontici]BCQ40175.1 outer membrane protein OmpW [Erwinia rhapontici]
MKLKALALALVTLLPAVASAHEAGDFFMRAGSATVRPTGGSDNVMGLGEFDIDNNTQLGLTFTYMATDNIGIELLGATPFKHHVGLQATGTLATVHQLPPTLMAQWYFMGNTSKWQPYAGIGVNYTMFYDTDFNDTGRAAGLSNLKVKNSWGVAGQLGLDYQLTPDWMLNASLWYMDINTKVSFDSQTAGHQSIDTHINPFVFFFGAGYRF